MSFRIISENSFPACLALSTDISGSVISGSAGAVALMGKTVYVTDTAKWFIITGASASAISLSVYRAPALET